MSRHPQTKGLAQCEVPGCVRSVGKVPGFCARCWGQMTDAEQQGLLFSRHAPFFPRYMSADGPFATDEVECHAPGAKPPGAPVGIRHESGWCFTDDLGDVEAKWFGGLGYRLRDYEARTTQAAIAQAVADRLDAARRASYA